MTLPKRTITELADALRVRADALCGEMWEVPATKAMMQEAADALRDAEARERRVLELIDEHVAHGQKEPLITAYLAAQGRQGPATNEEKT